MGWVHTWDSNACYVEGCSRLFAFVRHLSSINEVFHGQNEIEFQTSTIKQCTSKNKKLRDIYTTPKLLFLRSQLS